MLAAIDICLRPTRDCELPHPCAHLVHAAILDMVRSLDVGVSAYMHEEAQVKPFTVSTMRNGTDNDGYSLRLAKDSECHIRVTALNRHVFEAVSGPIIAYSNLFGTIRLNGQEFAIDHASTDKPDGEISSFSELWRDCFSSVIMDFISPTTFRRKGLNVPLPDPQLVYGSLWQKWQAFSGIDVDEMVYASMIDSLVVSRADIHTSIWKFPQVTLKGFVGNVQFELVKNDSTDAKRLFAALSRLAFYSGVGYKTTMGMGQCRIK